MHKESNRPIVNEKIIKEHGITLLDLIDETSRVYVWSAVQTNLDRSVFLIILKEEPSKDPVATQYFLQVARQFAKIKCDSLAAIFDIVSEDNLHYVIMEHVDGSSLDELLREKKSLSYNQVLQVATSMTGCLKQLWHNASIIHRNLKGSTIRFDTRGIAKLMDFSLAIISDPEFDHEVIDKGRVTCTPPFLSPEQAHGGKVLSTQSDMYSLGALLYYTSTGKAPFADLDAENILAAHISKTLPPPHKLNPKLPVCFSQLIHKLMMKEPEHRYQNWEELHHDLHCILDGKPPVCANVDILYLSTIVPDFTKPEKKAGDETSFKIKTKKRNKYLEEKQHSHVRHHNNADEQSRQFKQQLICWGILSLWFILLFWFRAVIQHDPQKKQELLDKVKDIGSAIEQLSSEADTDTAPKDSTDTPPEHPPAAVLKPVEAQMAEAPGHPPATPSLPLPAVLVDRLAQELKKGDLAAAVATAADQSIIFAGKDKLLTTLESIPHPNTLVAKYLRNNIGKSLVMNFKGKPRRVIPKKVSGGKVKLEANGRYVQINIASLSAEQKSLWIDTPKTMEEYIVFCTLLLQTQNANQAKIYADKCGPLEPVITKAAEL